ncbi:hypothetical protein ACJ41O_000720 [Fusarium nematophilum]
MDGPVDWSNPASFLRAIGQEVPRILSPDQVRTQARDKAKAIFASYEQLQQILERHEATIQKRWVKKTRQHRLKILLNAWPRMPTPHRPDFDAFRREGPEQRSIGTSHRDAFMWPYVNQEDLSQTKSLLLLLNARGRNLPSSFAAADCEAMHLGIVTKAITPIFLNQYTLILHGVTSADEYGKLLSWDDHEDAFDWMQNRKQFLPGEGLLVLEAQERLMTFLVDCCQAILHEIPKDAMTSSRYPIQPEPHLRTERETSGFDSLALMAAEAPYRVPAKLDLGRVEALLTAKASAQEDHLWALREDPSCFAQYVLDVRDHRQEMLKDPDGKPHPATVKGHEGILWTRVMGSVLSEAYLGLEVFSELRDQAKALKELQEKYQPDITPMGDLPREYMEALLRFRHFLDQAAKGPCGQLEQVVVASPPMRKFYVREPPTDPDSSIIRVVSRPGVRMNKTEQHLTWLLRTLWEDGHALFLARLPSVVDELERLLQSDQAARDLVSPYVSSIIGELAIVAQCVHQLDLYQPWAQTFETSFEDSREEHEAYFAAKAKPWAQIMGAFGDGNLAKAAKLGEPLAGRFTYPIQKRRTKENVDILRRSESSLDAFWASVDQLLQAKAGNLDGTAVMRLLTQSRTLQRTPEWVETPEPNKTAAAPPPIEQPLSPFYSGSPDTPRSHVSREQPKIKAKTRGAAGKSEEADADVAAATATPTPQPPPPSFQVDQRALKVFRFLFFNPDVTSSPGEVSWNDFLHALAAVEFSAEKLYGSVWQFWPHGLDVEASIHFHEPHPRGKLAFAVARRYGRRLHRTYGWTGEMFVLKR